MDSNNNLHGESLEGKILEVRKVLAKAKRVVFFTGAGISADSGIATFRGAGGIWNKLKPEELASFDAFLKNPDLVTEWYRFRRDTIHKSEPNAAHLAIAKAETIFESVIVITQNIDNLHNRAGSSVVYELHGNIERNYCIKCGKKYSDYKITDGKPLCDCGGLIRPEVVWFGEMLPEDTYAYAEEAAKVCDIFFSIGTTGIVFPAANMIYFAKEHGAKLIEINIDSTEVSRFADFTFRERAGIILPKLLEQVSHVH